MRLTPTRLTVPSLLLVDGPGRRGVRELGDGVHDAAPDRGTIEIALADELVDAPRALDLGIFAIALEHQIRCAPDVDLGDHELRIARPS